MSQEPFQVGRSDVADPSVDAPGPGRHGQHRILAEHAVRLAHRRELVGERVRDRQDVLLLRMHEVRGVDRRASRPGSGTVAGGAGGRRRAPQTWSVLGVDSRTGRRSPATSVTRSGPNSALTSIRRGQHFLAARAAQHEPVTARAHRHVVQTQLAQDRGRIDELQHVPRRARHRDADPVEQRHQSGLLRDDLDLQSAGQIDALLGVAPGRGSPFVDRIHEGVDGAQQRRHQFRLPAEPP